MLGGQRGHVKTPKPLILLGFLGAVNKNINKIYKQDI